MVTPIVYVQIDLLTKADIPKPQYATGQTFGRSKCLNIIKLNTNLYAQLKSQYGPNCPDAEYVDITADVHKDVVKDKVSKFITNNRAQFDAFFQEHRSGTFTLDMATENITIYDQA